MAVDYGPSQEDYDYLLWVTKRMNALGDPMAKDKIPSTRAGRLIQDTQREMAKCGARLKSGGTCQKKRGHLVGKKDHA